MTPMFVLEAQRTPTGALGGSLRGWHPVELVAELIRPWMDAGPLTVACATPVGEQAINMARSSALAADWDEATAASTVDAQGASGAAALLQAFGQLQTGADRVVVAGVESMTRVPLGASTGVAVGKPFGPRVHARYAEMDGLRAPGAVVEALARAHGIERASLDAYAERTTEAFAATARAPHGLTPLEHRNDKGNPTGTMLAVDEVISHDTGPSERTPIFEVDGLLTPSTFAAPADGAAALLLSLEDQSNSLGCIVDLQLSGSPTLAGSSGAGVAAALLQRAGVAVDAVDRFDVIEDSAVTPVLFGRELGTDPERVNPNGGALVTGLPVGAAIVAAVVQSLHAMRINGQHLGVVTVAGYFPVQASILLRVV